MTPSRKAAFDAYARAKTAYASAAIDLLAAARALHPGMPEQELVTLLADVMFPIIHQGLREVSLDVADQDPQAVAVHVTVAGEVP